MVVRFLRRTPLFLSIKQEGDEAPREGNQLDYLPFGVKTLKVEVNGHYRGKLRLAPVRFSQVPGEKLAHEDGDGPPQFVVSWGGGQENYYELDYPKKRIVHFLLRHVGHTLNNPTLSIRVWAVTKAGQDGDELLRMPVKLTYPADRDEPWPAELLVRPKWQELVQGSKGESDIILEGRYAPDYISRWWPKNRVIYDSYGKPPPRIHLHYRRLADGDSGDLTVYARDASGGEVPLATIQGRIRYPLYDMQQVVPELYRFGPQTWALRVWFFWLDKDISQDDLKHYGTRTDKEIHSDWQGLRTKADGGSAEKSWAEDNEIPDAERVDIVFSRDLEPLYAATDLHWREMWGHFDQPGKPVVVRIMNTHWQHMLLEDWGELGQTVTRWYNVLLAPFLHKQGMKGPYNPQLEVVRELAGQRKLGADAFKMESHTPAIMNVSVEPQLTSDDVTEG